MQTPTPVRVPDTVPAEWTAAPAPPTPPTPPAPPKRQLTWLPWVAMGAVLVLVVGILGALYMGQRSNAADLRDTVAARDERIAALNGQAAENKATIATLQGENAALTKQVTAGQNGFELMSDWVRLENMGQWDELARQINAELRTLFDGLPIPVRFTPLHIVPR
jgi:hypothetical protein